MKQITEDYVSFETAKLLKEKGFDEITFTWYTGKGKFCVGKNNFDDYHMNHLSNMAVARDKNKCSAPTQQKAMKWLREVHHYYIQVMLDSWACGGHLGYYVVIQKTDSDFEMMLQDAVDEVFYQTYEEAVEAALKYTLENLI